MDRPIVAIVGSTASGKTEFSLDLAERLAGEIVNTDAMAVYRGMDIGTATVPPDERRGIHHHLLDLLDVTDELSVAQFQGWARSAIHEIRARGHSPILVGGSALYTRGVVDRFDFPGTDASLRRELEDELDRRGAAVLYQRLAALDPEAAAAIQRENGRRIVRALEVIALTGRPFSASLPSLTYADPVTIQIGVAIDRITLDQRIRTRVEGMFEAGFIDEVDRLLTAGLANARTASRAIGYREVAGFLAGDRTLAEAKEQTTAATRRFARRQDSWFRKDPRIVWVHHDDPDRVERALSAVDNLDQA